MTSGPAAFRATRRGGLRRPSRVLSVAGAAATVCLLATGCHVTGASSASLGMSTITVAAQPGVDDAPLYLAQRDGLFQAAGLTVTIQNYTSVSKEITALSNGGADFAVGDYADFFYGENSPSRPGFLIVADGYDAAPSVMEILTRSGSPITSPQQLAHKTIGTPEADEMPFSGALPYSEETLAADAALSNDEVKPSSVHWDPMATSQLVPALQNKRVDAILATEPTIFQAESQLGATEVLDACSGQTDSLPLDGYFALGSFAHKYRSTVLAFQSALLKAQAQAAVTSSVQTVLQSDVHMSAPQASLISLGTYPTALKASNLQRVATLMSVFNVLNPPLNVSGMIFR